MIVRKLEQMGAPREAVENARRQAAADAPADLELYEDVAPSVAVFQAMSTQWRRGGMEAIRTGLDYQALPTVMRFAKVAEERETQVFSDVRVMEEETLRVDAERAAA